MRVDYRSFLDKIWEALPAAEYVAMASDPHVLGNPLLKTQHFIGSSKWEYVSETEAIGWHQLRVPHQRYTDESRKEVAVKGHAHGSNQHWYKKIDGVWKFAGLAPIIRWGEFDFESVFASGRETFGDKEQIDEQVAVTAGVSADIGQANAEQNLESTFSAVQHEQEKSAEPSTGTVHTGDEAVETTPFVDLTPPTEGTKLPAEDVSVVESQSEQSKSSHPVLEHTSATRQHEQMENTKSLTEDLPVPQPDQTEQVTPPAAVEHIKGPTADVMSDQDEVELLQMAREDGKLFEMQVEQVAAEDVSITA